jgi:hypothetical protein
MQSDVFFLSVFAQKIIEYGTVLCPTRGIFISQALLRSRESAHCRSGCGRFTDYTGKAPGHPGAFPVAAKMQNDPNLSLLFRNLKLLFARAMRQILILPQPI